MTDHAAADDTASPSEGALPPAGPEDSRVAPESAPHRAESFLRQVSAWIGGKDAPTDAVSAGCLEDLRANLVERQKIQEKGQKMEQALREQQAAIFSSQGREDGLLKVLHRATAGAAK